jgi:hypothetical protein
VLAQNPVAGVVSVWRFCHRGKFGFAMLKEKTRPALDSFRRDWPTLRGGTIRRWLRLVPPKFRGVLLVLYVADKGAGTV